MDNSTDNWYFLVKNTDSSAIATIEYTGADTFDTDINLQELPDDNSVWRQPLFGYPLDRVSSRV